MRVLSFSDIAGEARKKETNDDKRANKSHSSLAIVGQAHTVCSILLNKVDGLIVHVAGMLSNAPRFIVFNFSLLSYAISCFFPQMRSALTDVDSDHSDQSIPSVDFITQSNLIR